MTTAAVLVWSVLVGVAHGQGCLAAVEAGLRPGAPPLPTACVEADAAWLDDAGPASGPEAVRAGLARLGAALDGSESPRWVRLSTQTWLLTGLKGRRGWFHVSWRLSGRRAFFEEGRVYHGARPWPEARGEEGAPGYDSDTFVAAFNGLFGAGRVEELVAHWAPDAAFVSGIGPFVGPEVGLFFRRQAGRYEAPAFTDVTHHGRDAHGAWTFEGVLTAHCRSTGAPFRMPFLMALRYSGERIGYLYEAFTRRDDGCGPFWATPR